MNKKLVGIFLGLILIVSGCTVSKQNPQNSPTLTLQPTSAPSQQGALPEVDYTIPNGQALGSHMVTDGKKLFFLDTLYGIISCNPNGTDVKQILKRPKISCLPYHELSYSKGWLYYVTTDGIYKIKPDGKNKTKLYGEKDLVYDEDLCRVLVTLVVGDTLYYGYEKKENDRNISLYCVDKNGRKLIEKDYYAFYPQYAYLTSYEGCVYYFSNDELLMKYDPSKGKSENVLYYKIKSLISVINGIVYYVDENNNICLYHLKTKQKEKLTDKIDANPYSVIQFHNYLIFVGKSNDISGLVCFDIKTKKKFILKDFPTETFFLEFYPTNDYVYILNAAEVFKLSFKEGKAIIEPLEKVGDILLNGERYNLQD